MKTVLARIGKFLLILLSAALAILILYVAYVLLTYYRLPDNQALVVENPTEQQAEIGETYVISTFNLGFGAYSADYSFFMDGGTESIARSEKAVKDNVAGAVSALAAYDPDFLFFQEVDVDSTRSWHVNLFELLQSVYPDKAAVYAQNYDSPFLFYPPLQPHGKSVAGIVTLSDCEISSAVRRSLPIDEGLGKLVDLDRCYTVSRIPTEDGRELVLFNVHLTAYASDPSIVRRQVEMLVGQMQDEYAAGNCIICGGDFNQDLWGDSSEYLGKTTETPSWAHAFPLEDIPAGISLVTPSDRSIPTCRDACEAYEPGHTFVTVVDGFFISDNLEVVDVRHVDAGFAYSDHNPVVMTFRISRN